MKEQKRHRQIVRVPKLHKYMSAQRLVDILRSPSLRYTQPEYLNDPYECHLTLDRHEVLRDYRKYRKEQSPELDEVQLTAAVECAEEQLILDELLGYRALRQGLGVLSLTEDPLHLLMWAHYGDEHKGVAIELDIAHPALIPNFGSSGGYSGLKPVKYTRKKIFGVPRADKMIEVLSTKPPDWRYEKEWRLIRTLNFTRQVNEHVYVVDIDLKAIKTIYLGGRFPPKLLAEVVPLARENGGEHIKFVKVDIAPHKFELRTTDAEKYGWVLMHREHHFGEAAPEALTCLPMDNDR